MSVEARPQALHLLGGFIVTQALAAIARLGIADLVAERPRTVDELAVETGADTEALARFIRALSSVGVFTTIDGLVRNTEIGELFREGVPGSLRWLALPFSQEHYRAWGDAFETVQTGEPAFPRVFGSEYFDWLATHPAEADAFNRAMAAGAAARRIALVERNWSAVETVVDVGGGTGTMLAGVLTNHPHLHGTVFDLEHARREAEETIEAAGMGDRCSFAAGSFFERVPAGADVYLLAQILHDWDDERAIAILRSCRAAARPDSRLLLVEAVLQPGDEPDWAKMLDLHMLVLLGGRERSEAEWRALLEHGGFALDGVVRTAAATVLEAIPLA